ncbi:type I-E CRISPR-associated protein Cas6/Cse3/CasE [Streptococcus merionis]|uniref:type I-E CRISPR-associated protein Cas6/Cse3/CasE n=1 Tax=Streptococcus merionis TaxID=400065 RepID=UPI0026ECF997|nr:type I-E CRISPR-associated protein Cas6/Cse3/CasE [Streptococcus merionis]
MYISRVEIDRTNRRKIHNLVHVGAYHAWVEESFPNEFKQSIRTRKLWRVDRIKDKDYLIIVSKGKPDLQQLEKYGVKGTAQTKDYQRFLDGIHIGSRMRFRVVLNPVVSIASPENTKRGVVKPHVTSEHQMNYLLERSEKNGFLLVRKDCSIVERSYEVFKKSVKPIRLIKVVYEGTLTVRDVKLFKKLLIEGIGKKKAYGFGLMTVIPLGDD